MNRHCQLQSQKGDECSEGFTVPGAGPHPALTGFFHSSGLPLFYSSLSWLHLLTQCWIPQRAIRCQTFSGCRRALCSPRGELASVGTGFLKRNSFLRTFSLVQKRNTAVPVHQPDNQVVGGKASPQKRLKTKTISPQRQITASNPTHIPHVCATKSRTKINSQIRLTPLPPQLSRSSP